MENNNHSNVIDFSDSKHWFARMLSKNTFFLKASAEIYSNECVHFFNICFMISVSFPLLFVRFIFHKSVKLYLSLVIAVVT